MAAAAVYLLGRLCLELFWNSGVHSVLDSRMVIIVDLRRVCWIGWPWPARSQLSLTTVTVGVFFTPSEMTGWSASGATPFLDRTFVGSESRSVHEDLANSQDVKALLEVRNANRSLFLHVRYTVAHFHFSWHEK